MVARVCNPSYLGGRGWEDFGLRLAQENVIEAPSQPISWAWWCTPVIPAKREVYIGESLSRPAWTKTQYPTEK
jgi:hypothetical protein